MPALDAGKNRKPSNSMSIKEQNYYRKLIAAFGDDCEFFRACARGGATPLLTYNPRHTDQRMARDTKLNYNQVQATRLKNRCERYKRLQMEGEKKAEREEEEGEDEAGEEEAEEEEVEETPKKDKQKKKKKMKKKNKA